MLNPTLKSKTVNTISKNRFTQYDRMMQLFDQKSYGCISKHGDYYYYAYSEGNQKQSSIYRQKTLNDTKQLFLDPNKLSSDGTLAISQTAFSRDGLVMAYTISEKGNSKQDILIADFRELDDPNLNIVGSVSRDGRFLFVYVYDRVLTDHSAPNRKLIRIKITTAMLGCAHWETLIAEDPKRALESVVPVAGDKLMVIYIEDVKTFLYVHCYKTGKLLYKIPLGIGTVSQCYGDREDTEAFFSFNSFLEAPTIYRADFSLVAKTSLLQLEQIRHRNEWRGVNVTGLEHFHGIVAIANIRGGGEYGEHWHECGAREHKQNVFDDFISAAEFLIKNKFTSPKKLAIQGGSNGGLLVAACSHQRPELFGAVINQVGVMDMLRFHKFTVGSFWISEYGDPEKSSEFEYIFRYSPLHNIRLPRGVQWPATLLM
uniref:Prolyl endopeptidase n=1 Tax=Meloidogyne javanica TaxID=6303 RepID=A0A915NBW0_MELJA